MKTILVYTERVNASYDGLFLSLMREGRRRGWRFAWVAPEDGTAKSETERLARLFARVKPVGFVGGYIKRHPVRLPRGIPSVWIDSGHAPAGAPLVHHDNASFGRAAADALGAYGESFAVVGLKHHVWAIARERAFVERLREDGRRCRVLRFPKDGLFHPYALFEDIRAALSRLKRPASVFAVTDQLADMTLMAAESLGWRCPRDLRIIGVDDDEIVCMASPTPLSSVRPDWTLGGRLIAEALETQMRGDRPRREYVYGAAGVVRRSTTRVPHIRPRDNRVEKALAFIAAEVASSSVKVADVAAAMGCSRSLAELRFREETGRGIAETLVDARLERVQVMLRSDDVDIAALPAMCGFRTAAALRSAFRRRMGMSMTAWRKFIKNSN